MIIVIILEILILAMIILAIILRPKKVIRRDERGWMIKASSLGCPMLILRNKEEKYAIPLRKEEEERIKKWLKQSTK